MLSGDLQSRIVDALDEVPIANTLPGRNSLLIGIPNHIVNGLNRDAHRSIDLSLLVKQLYDLGRLEETGIRPLLIFLNAALKTVEGTSTGRKIKDLIQEVERRDEENELAISPPPISSPDIPEGLVFGGNDERLSLDFFKNAISVQTCVARLQVPRIFGVARMSGSMIGTGWLIAPNLLCTNYHVIEARDRSRNERPATPAEFYAQALSTTIWFDYHSEGGSRIECQCLELVGADPVLDYALLRLENEPNIYQRSPLRIAPHISFYQGDRLNIVQYPAGGALRYAIRNNFYVGEGQNTNFIRYLTDTEYGASGSPICNDDWYVIGMHRAAYAIHQASYRGEVIKYHNEGIEIHAILNHLPREIYQEIAQSQGW